MKVLGVDISPLLVGSSVILVGIGLGLQNLFLDFISGVIILLDRTIQVGDVVDIDGVIGEVQEIKMRTTTILTRDNKSIIFPNSVLTKNRLVNFSHNDEVVAFEITVGVHYDTDLELLEKLMLEAALENESVLKEPAPSVRLENFGDSSLDFKMFYNTKNLFRQPTMRSNIRKSILRKFRENGISIPYPIRTLEFPKNTFQ
jgi:small-conductance mechanosensitive channel